jgi:pimeloyl-ACP methyl ester carboxylesterase
LNRATASAAEFLKLADGRRLCFRQFGDPGGQPLLYCHGFPSCRLEAGLMADAASAAGARLIAADRPGMGGSSPQSGRRIGDWPQDLAALADHLGLARFHLLGVSGGAPFAMACATAFPERILGLGLVCGLGSLEGTDAGAKMGWMQRRTIDFARAWPALAQPLYTGLLAPTMARHPDLVLSLLVPHSARVDREVLASPEVRGLLRANIRETFRQGGAAASRELWLFTHRWEPDPRRVAVPTRLWHGEADRTVPVEMGRRHARLIPECHAEFLPAEGHFSLPVLHGRRILEELLAV